MQTADRTTQATADQAAQTPLALGRYRLVRRLGAGAFGVVWLAHDEQLERMVAVKRIELRDAQVAARAEREALAAARLSHPAIVALHEAGRDDGAIHLVSELVRGPALADLLEAGALSDRDVLRIGIALCDALEHAHERGVVHRDVKPANVIVPERPAGESGLAKLTDFGVAAIAGDDGLTRTGDVVGTLAYMAPEQAEGGRVSGAADLYALALVLYEALSGANPVRAGGAAATARRVGTRLPSLSRPRPDLPHELCEAIDIALLPDPDDRGTLGDLRETLAWARDGARREVGHVSAWAGEPDWHDASRGTPARGERPVDWRAAGVGRRADPEHGGLPHLSLPARASLGLLAGTLAGLAAHHLPPAPGEDAIAAVPVAMIVAAGASLAPRLTWLAALVALAAALVATGLAGVALLVLAAALPLPLLLPRSGAAWWAPGAGALAALAGAASAWPALAGQASGPLRRALLGAAGLWWALLLEPIAGRALLVGLPDPEPPRDGWTTSAATAAGDVLVPLVDSGALLLALPWAGAALLLPVLVRGRSLPVDLVAVVFWAAALAATSAALAAGLQLTPDGSGPRGAWAGAVLGATIALGAAAARAPRSQADLP